MRYTGIIGGLVGVVMVLYSCTRKEPVEALLQPEELTAAPVGFPPVPFPADNPFTIRKWELGKKLFYDNVLSVDNSINCGSCHHPALAFSDAVPKSLGAGNTVGKRNSPSLANVAYHPYYTREGGVPTLEMQILVPIQEHDEFNFNIVEIADRLKQIPEYVAMSKEIFDRLPDPYVITRAIATFERTLISGNSNYDKYLYQSYTSILSPAEKRGINLFYSTRTNCGNCHSGFNFTNYSFQNNGLYEVYTDNGRERLTNNSADNALFKVPSLRNIALTAPYMHDGSMATLHDVVEHYNLGGKPHPNKSPMLQPLGLTTDEKEDLIAFLQTLTDVTFTSNKNLQNEP
ncbi:MAG: c-type cytochrome [Taibaiella sp.]|nr:c-type cytochrome [Taibaiella sp.]